MENKELSGIESEIDQISIAGRYAFGLAIIEKYIFENEIDRTNIINTIEVLYEFLNVKSLDLWESKISEFNPSNVLDNHSDNTSENYEMTKSEFMNLKALYKSLPKELLGIMNKTIGLGTANLYCGFNSRYTREYVIDLISLNNQHLKNPVNFNYFKKYRIIKGDEWGEKILKEEIINGW